MEFRKNNKSNNNKVLAKIINNNNEVIVGTESVTVMVVGVDLHKEKVLLEGKDTMMTKDQAVSKRGEHTNDIAVDINGN